MKKIPTLSTIRLTATRAPTRSCFQVSSWRCGMSSPSREQGTGNREQGIGNRRKQLPLPLSSSAEYRVQGAVPYSLLPTPYPLFPVPCPLSPIIVSGEELPQIRILTSDQVVPVSLEIEPGVAKKEKADVVDRGSLRSAGGRYESALLNRIGKTGQKKGVLKALGNDHGSRMLGVAQLGDEQIDGVGGERIEARGGRVVEHDRGLADDGPRDGHAPLHPARKLRRRLVNGLFHFHEAQHLAHSPLDLSFVSHLFLAQSVAHVLINVERIEQRAFLEHDPHLAPQRNKLRLGERNDVLPVYQDLPGVRLHQAQHDLEEYGLAGAGDAEQKQSLPWGDREGKVDEHLLFVERQRDVTDLDGRERGGLGMGSQSGHFSKYELLNYE